MELLEKDPPLEDELQRAKKRLDKIQEVLDRIDSEPLDTDKEDEGFKKPHIKFNLEAALKVLEAGPPPEHRVYRTKEQIEEIEKILREIDSLLVDEDGPTDASENLDKYICG